MVILFVSGVGISQATGAAWAFGYYANQAVKGHRVYIWTDTPPNGLRWTATPVGLCQFGTPCGGKLIETGWIKGTDYGMGDAIVQYVGYQILMGIGTTYLTSATSPTMCGISLKSCIAIQLLAGRLGASTTLFGMLPILLDGPLGEEQSLEAKTWSLRGGWTYGAGIRSTSPVREHG